MRRKSSSGYPLIITEESEDENENGDVVIHRHCLSWRSQS